MPESSSHRRTIAVVTGSRAEFGLLTSVMRAIEAHPELTLRAIVTGTHLLPPANTIDEVARQFEIDWTVEMQLPGESDRFSDAKALGRGVTGLTDAFVRLEPDVVLVLGDRIEAFAAASAASIAGIRVAHLHGGDRAEGLADEALRHAITKLAHIHFPATAFSAERILSMGEELVAVHLVGSPAIDDLDSIPELDESIYRRLGKPEIVFLHHPVGRPEMDEYLEAAHLLESCMRFGEVLAIHPNHDPGRDGILRAIRETGCPNIAHLPRREFIGLLRHTHLIVGNSSAGMIECAAIGAWSITVGTRQLGREKPRHVVDVVDCNATDIEAALNRFLFSDPYDGPHPYGNGKCGLKVANILATFTERAHPLRKLNSF